MYTMILVLSKQKHGLSIVHINAHSPKNNMEEFRYTFENQIQTLYAFLRRGFRSQESFHCGRQKKLQSSDNGFW